MTELVWDGKYVDGKRQSPVRVALPFQTIETVNESTADRHKTLELFSSGRPTEWRNRLTVLKWPEPVTGGTIQR